MVEVPSFLVPEGFPASRQLSCFYEILADRNKGRFKTAHAEVSDGIENNRGIHSGTEPLSQAHTGG
jgi:hypothetical protein